MEVFSVGGGVGPYTPSLVGGTGTTNKVFPSVLGTGFGNGGNALGAPPSSTFLTPPTANTAPTAQLSIPGTGQYEQQVVDVRASGVLFVHGTSPTINFIFANGSSFTSGSNTTMATLTTAQSLTTAAAYPWAFKCQLQGDSVSGIMQVMNATFYCNNTSQTLTLTALTGINLTTTQLTFVCGVTFTVSDALNKAALSQWELVP